MPKSEDLSNWYFRLNGFLTIPNFILHPSGRGPERTDTDVVGIRFPFRNEFQGDEVDDPKLHSSSTKPSFFIVEVKTNEINLNDAWTSSQKNNINKIITDLGVLQGEKIAEVAESLYGSGRFDGESYYWSLVLVGNIDTGRVPGRYESVPRIFWTDICKFIHRRMRTFWKEKADHSQWDHLGKKLYDLAEKHQHQGEFERAVRLLCDLPTT